MKTSVRLSSQTGHTLSRRSVLALSGSAITLPLFGQVVSAAPDENALSEDAVLRDPAIPTAGNPQGDISFVEWFDYQCPYCRKMAPDLRKLVADDGKLRMVFKDWPILGPVSVYAAKMVLAAKWQDKYLPAHEALIESPRRLTEANVRERLAGAGVDVDRATREAAERDAEISAVLARTDAQAKAFGFRGTPSFIVGKFRVPGILTMDQFAMAIADARKAARTSSKPGEKL